MSDFTDAIAAALRESSLGKAMFGARYGDDQSQRPDVLAIRHARELGFPDVGGSRDSGQAQRYFSAKQFVKNHPTVGPAMATAGNRLHEAMFSWLPGLDEGGPNLGRIEAGDRGIQQALSELEQGRGRR